MDMAGSALSYRNPSIKLGILNRGHEYYLAAPDPPDNLFTIHHNQTGYA